MDFIKFKINRYQITLERDTVQVGNKEYSRIGLINCIGPNQKTDIVKFINIHFIEIDESGSLPDNSITKVNNQYIIDIRYNASYYALFIDMLRYEKEPYCEFTIEDPQHNRLRSEWKLVSECN